MTARTQSDHLLDLLIYPRDRVSPAPHPVLSTWVHHDSSTATHTCERVICVGRSLNVKGNQHIHYQDDGTVFEYLKHCTALNKLTLRYGLPVLFVHSPDS